MNIREKLRREKKILVDGLGRDDLGGLVWPSQ